jgi:membrane-associated phospholipid phosphatase
MRAPLCLTLLVLGLPVCAQRDSSVYRVDPWIEVPLIAAGSAAFITGMDAQAQRAPLTAGDLHRLGTLGVPGLDRAALRIDPTGQEPAMRTSDRILYGTMAAPVLMLIDPRVREEWQGVFTLYLETASLTAGMQAWSCVSAGRYRPIAYIPEATLEQRIDQRNSHSFYSGHTANTAMASFFMAKVLSDMHPELGSKRWWFYGAAVVPPALVGYYRVQAGKHFPTDVLTGALMGAATGVLVPALHKRRGGDRFTLAPITSPDQLGLYLAVKW